MQNIQPMASPHDKLLTLTGAAITLSAADEVLVRDSFEPLSAVRNTLLETHGKAPRYLYFINSGFVRVFYESDGNEVTSHINCPPGFITSFENFINRRPAADNVQCITDCELLRISLSQLDELGRNLSGWPAFSRQIYEKSIAYNEQRTRDLISLNARERYLRLMDEQPAMLQAVPLQYIASYLGIEPQSLSRIRRKIIS